MTSRTRPPLAEHNARASLESEDQWMAELGKVRAGFSRVEERALATRIRAGDTAAIGELVEGNLRFAVAVAKKYQHRGIPLADLIQEANAGLTTAAHKFDPDRNVKFISYAVWWIRQAILQAIAEQGRTVRVPLHRAGEIQRLRLAHDRLAGVLHREPTLAETAEEAGIEPDVAGELFRLISPAISMNAPLGDDGSPAREVGDLIADHHAASAYVDVEDHDTARFLRERIAIRLSPREMMIVERYFGLGGDECHTLESISQTLGVTRERVRQIKEKALEKLRGDPLLHQLSRAA
jgi:RNA polymerase primary sigma factor